MTARKPTTGELLDRIEVLEHGLHETRQRADLVTAALFEVAQMLVVDLYGNKVDSTQDFLHDRAAAALADTHEAQRSRPLEPQDCEGWEPDWDDPDDPDAPTPTADEVRLAGSRARRAGHTFTSAAELLAAITTQDHPA